MMPTTQELEQKRKDLTELLSKFCRDNEVIIGHCTKNGKCGVSLISIHKNDPIIYFEMAGPLGGVKVF